MTHLLKKKQKKKQEKKQKKSRYRREYNALFCIVFVGLMYTRGWTTPRAIFQECTEPRACEILSIEVGC